MNNNPIGIFTVIAILIAVIASVALLAGVENAFPDEFPDIKQSTVVDNSPIDQNAGDDLLLTVITQQ